MIKTADSLTVIDCLSITSYLPRGTPRVTFTLPGLPSVNEVLYLKPIERAGVIAQERSRGRHYGGDYLEKTGIPIVIQPFRSKGRVDFYRKCKEPVFKGRVFCFVEIVRKASAKDPTRGSRKRDIYNLLIKGFIDGLTDAGLWVDDNEDYHTDLWVHYAGVAPEGKVEIKLYEI